jgi:diadenosine tetraphosphate (Ap4A) HIT family hydrolase
LTACIFCDILSGAAPASFVFRDDVCAAFMDIQPVNPGHLLVVPRRHAPDLAALAPEDGAQLMRVAQRLAAAVRRSGVRCEGVDLFLADGAAAGQEVFHVHLHVIPRYAGDGFGFRFGPDYGKLPPRAELDRLAAAVRAAANASKENP